MGFGGAVWLRNWLRNKVGRGGAGARLERLRIVSATRLNEKAFWLGSALGESLAALRTDPRLSFDIAFENTAGLPQVYNARLRDAAASEAILFIHDDIWLDDPEWIEKVFTALQRYDVIGLAGNRRRVKRQPAWLYTKVENGRFWLDSDNLSGAVAHGKLPRGEVTYFGPSPAACELLDGLFIAARCDVLLASGVAFDERFKFHFYDLDFCRSARAAGLSIGTWPIEVTHQSTGAFHSTGWQDGLARYLGKWLT